MFRALRSHCFSWYSEILAKMAELKREFEHAQVLGSTPEDCTSLLAALTETKEILGRWGRALRPTKGELHRVDQFAIPIESSYIFECQCIMITITLHVSRPKTP
jgi:hypothetical protein